MTQFHQHRFFLVIFLLFACITPCVSAYVVSSVNADPPGYQAAGTPMTVTFVVEFPNKGANVTFLQDNEMQMSTDLTGVSWDPVMVLDGMTTHMDQKAGDSMTISGWYLSYPSYQDLQSKMTVKGKIPANPSPDMNILKIEEADAGKNIVSTARIAMPQAPFMTPTTLSTPTKKPTIKKTFTPLATDTTQASPAGIGAAFVAIIGAALLVMKRR